MKEERGSSPRAPFPWRALLAGHEGPDAAELAHHRVLGARRPRVAGVRVRVDVVHVAASVQIAAAVPGRSAHQLPIPEAHCYK